MAAKTWYLTNASVSVGSDLSDSDPGAEALRSPVTGWIVGTGSTNHSEYRNDGERAASSFTGTTFPDGSLDTANGDFWVSPAPLTGSFASADWNVHFACRAGTGGDTQDGRMRCRLLRGANQDGSGAVEITSAQQQGGLVTDLLTSATQVSTATFNPGAFSVNNEYVFVQLAWERTGAAGMTTYDVNVRIGNASGNGSRVVTADFTPAVTGTLATTNAADSSSASGTITVAGSAATTNAADTSSASGAVTVAGSSATVNANDASSASGTVSASGITGTSATVNAADTSSAAGAVTVSGSASTLNAADTSSASGQVTVAGSAATTNAADTSSASGTLTVTGSSAGANANDASSASGTITIAGSAATTNAADASSAAGTVTVSGSASTLNAADASAASGLVRVIGASMPVNANDASAAAGVSGQITPLAAMAFLLVQREAEFAIARRTAAYAIARRTAGFTLEN